MEPPNGHQVSKQEKKTIWWPPNRPHILAWNDLVATKSPSQKRKKER